MTGGVGKAVSEGGVKHWVFQGASTSYEGTTRGAQKNTVRENPEKILNGGFNGRTPEETDGRWCGKIDQCRRLIGPFAPWRKKEKYSPRRRPQ